MAKIRVTNVILKIADRSARRAVCSNSPWNYYQLKEPKNLRKKF